MSPNRLKHRLLYKKRGEALTTLQREWRIRLGESPNPWGIDCSQNEDHLKGAYTQQIITRHRLSRLERLTLNMQAEVIL